MGALVVGSSVVVVSALCLGLALFVRRPTAQPAIPARSRPGRPVTTPSTVAATAVAGATAGRGATAAARSGSAGGVTVVTRPGRATTARPRRGPAGRQERARRRADRRLRDGPGPKPQIHTPTWVRLRSGALLGVSVVAIAALVGAVTSLVIVVAALVLT